MRSHVSRPAGVLVLAAGLIAGCSGGRADYSRPSIGLRAGMLAPLAESVDDYRPGFTFGLHCADRMGASLIEAGIDLSWNESADGNVDAELYLFRLDLLLSSFRMESRDAKPYAVVGYEVVMSDALRGENVSGLTLGLGLTSIETRWDVRCTYSFLVGSDNIQGLLMATGGYRF